MLGGFFCGPKTKRSVSKSKKRKTSGGKTKKAKKTVKGKSGKTSFRKYVRGSKTKRRSGRRSSTKRRRQTGGAAVGHDLCDSLGRGTYPVAFNSATDCSGVHHK